MENLAGRSMEINELLGDFELIILNVAYSLGRFSVVKFIVDKTIVGVGVHRILQPLRR